MFFMNDVSICPLNLYANLRNSIHHQWIYLGERTFLKLKWFHSSCFFSIEFQLKISRVAQYGAFINFVGFFFSKINRVLSVAIWVLEVEKWNSKIRISKNKKKSCRLHFGQYKIGHTQQKEHLKIVCSLSISIFVNFEMLKSTFIKYHQNQLNTFFEAMLGDSFRYWIHFVVFWLAKHTFILWK